MHFKTTTKLSHGQRVVVHFSCPVTYTFVADKRDFERCILIPFRRKVWFSLHNVTPCPAWCTRDDSPLIAATCRLLQIRTWPSAVCFEQFLTQIVASVSLTSRATDSFPLECLTKPDDLRQLEKKLHIVAATNRPLTGGCREPVNAASSIPVRTSH